MDRRGSSVFSGVALHDMMQKCPDLEKVGRKDFWLPVGTWERGERDCEARLGRLDLSHPTLEHQVNCRMFVLQVQHRKNIVDWKSSGH